MPACVKQGGYPCKQADDTKKSEIRHYCGEIKNERWDAQAGIDAGTPARQEDSRLDVFMKTLKIEIMNIFITDAGKKD